MLTHHTLPSIMQVRAIRYGMSSSRQPRRRSLPSQVRMHQTPMEAAMPWANHLCPMAMRCATGGCSNIVCCLPLSPGRLPDPANASVRHTMQACQEQHARMSSLVAVTRERRPQVSLLRHTHKLQQSLLHQQRWPPSSQVWPHAVQLGHSLRSALSRGSAGRRQCCARHGRCRRAGLLPWPPPKAVPRHRQARRTHRPPWGVSWQG